MQHICGDAHLLMAIACSNGNCERWRVSARLLQGVRHKNVTLEERDLKGPQNTSKLVDVLAR